MSEDAGHLEPQPPPVRWQEPVPIKLRHLPRPLGRPLSAHVLITNRADGSRWAECLRCHADAQAVDGVVTLVHLATCDVFGTAA